MRPDDGPALQNDVKPDHGSAVDNDVKPDHGPAVDNGRKIFCHRVPTHQVSRADWTKLRKYSIILSKI